MSRISAIDPQTAASTVKPLLDGVNRGLGMVPNLFRVAAHSTASLEALTSFFGAVTKGRFDAKLRESIALAVSEANACDYCLSAHSALGQKAGLGPDAISSARDARADDPHTANVLKLARAIVDRRGRVEGADLARLSEADVVETVANVALTVFTNYLNEVARTDIDFPLVAHRGR